MATFAIVSGLSPVQAALASAATACAPPVIREASVNQGLGGYTQPLSYGKQTLVKLYLTDPACDTNGGDISLASGSTLTVANSVTSQTFSVGTPQPVATQSPQFVLYGQYSPSGDVNSTADPIFTVPGSDLAPLAAGATSGAAFTATFTAYINYTVSGSSTVNTLPKYQFTASFDKQGNPIKVLVVPMGDSTSTVTQFSDSAQRSIVSAMTTLDRVYPVSDHTGPLPSPGSSWPPPGVQYAINPMMNIGPSGSGLMNMTTSPYVPFCGTPNNFSKIQTGLDQALAVFNANNPTTPATRVLGVIDQSIVDQNGIANFQCVLGYAAVNGAEAWSEDTWNSSPVTTAALASMELGHTYGLSPVDPNGATTDCSHAVGDSNHHSQNITADLCSPGRGFDTQGSAYLFPNYSVSRFGTGWADGTILMENYDYQFAQCELGGSNTFCLTTSPTAATASAASSQPRFVLSGLINNSSSTSSTADVTESYLSPNNTDYETPTVQSRWGLMYFDSNGLPICSSPTQCVDGILVTFGQSEHGFGTGDGGTSSTGDFEVSRPLPTGTIAVELVDTAAPPTSPPLYTARRDQFAPVVTTAIGTAPSNPLVQATGPSDYTNTTAAGQNEARPAISGSGATALVGWTDASGLEVAPLSAPTDKALVPGTAGAGATNPAYSTDGKELAYEDANGDIFTVSGVAWDGNSTHPPTFGSSQEIYNSIANSGIAPAHHPAFAPANVASSAPEMAVEYNGDLFVINLTATAPLGCTLPGQVLTGSCQQITGSSNLVTPGTDSDPSWSPDVTATDSAYNKIAFVRSGSISTVDPAKGEGSVQSLISNAFDPSWSNGLMAFQRGGNIWVADPAQPATQQQLTGLGTASAPVDVRPSLSYSSGGAVVFQRQFQNPSQTDVMVMQLQPSSANPGTTTYSAAASDGDNPPQSLKADFLRVCSDHKEVLATAQKPVDYNGQVADFQLTVNPAATPTLGCSGAAVEVLVNDGFLTGSQTGASMPGAANPQPIVAIRTPAPNTVFRQGHITGLFGSAYDADHGVLPGSDLSWSVTGGGHSYSFPSTDRAYLTLPAGAYTATLSATDGTLNASGQVSFTVVADQPPVPYIDSPAPGAIIAPGTALVVSGHWTDTEDSSYPASGLDWVVTAPNGSLQHVDGQSQFTLTPQQPGQWTIRLTATDSDGSSTSISETFSTAYLATTKFSPSTFNSPPLPSDPNWVTVNVTLASQDLTQVNPSSLLIVQIGPYNKQNDPTLFPTLYGGCQVATNTCSPQNGWRVSGTFGSSSGQTGTVQFDRIALATYLAEKGLNTGQYVPITVAGSAPTWAFLGTDPQNPTVT